MDASGRSLDQVNLVLVGTADWLEPLSTAMQAEMDATIQIVETATNALELYRTDHVDCLITGIELADGTGVELTQQIREHTTTLPIVLCTPDGSEAVASEAIAAGVTDYIPVSSSAAESSAVVVDRVDDAVREGHRNRTERSRARQFDAVFHDTATASWVLAPDGTLLRVNRTAREMVGSEAGDLVERRFWRLPWWSHNERVQADIRDVIQRASATGASQQLVTSAGTREDDRTIELSIHAVENPDGTINALVVEGIDVTDRVDLHRDLRQSERLHRVTLNNMTDTVLVTDDSGSFTYVCPNVHFIFGYSADEIHELGSIDQLLGEDVVDPGALADEGVLTNIECVATDKAGQDHSLLVNVREVDIQGGTRLYSCRDVTKRKQREVALRTLHSTTRNLLYAETGEEIAQLLVEDTPAILDIDASAIYLFRQDKNILEPVASTPEMDASHGPLHRAHPGPEMIVGHCFIEDERRFFEDVRQADRLTNQATDLRSTAYIPLGEHGVYVVGTTESGVFDSLRRELTDLVAATAEAALDRVERESRLREQDRELQRRNEQLTELNEMNELIRGIDRAIVQAETREEIDHAVCETLTDGDRFAFAWIGDVDDVKNRVEPRAWAGGDSGYLDSVDLSLDGGGDDPAVRSADDGSVTLVSNVAGDLRADTWRKAAIRRGYQSVLAVPLGSDEFTHGVLTVYATAPGAIDDMASVLVELGETVSAAISALERKHALLTATVTRLEFETRDETFGLLDLSQRAACALTVSGGIQQSNGAVSMVASLTGGTATDVLDAARELPAIQEVHSVGDDTDSDVVQLSVARPFFALPLADHGATLHSIEVDSESARIAVEVPEQTDTRHVIDHMQASIADVELVAKRRVERTPSRALYSTFLDRLTDRQLEVVKTAYYAGYFESPRERSGEEIADALNISPPAFYRHTRTVEQKLFTTLFDDVGIHVNSSS